MTTLRSGLMVGVLATLATSGCTPKRPASDPTPVIAISPGVAGRIALLDRYGLHDGARRFMTKRPRVWVEEVPEEDETEGASSDGHEAANVDDAAVGPSEPSSPSSPSEQGSAR